MNLMSLINSVQKLQKLRKKLQFYTKFQLLIRDFNKKFEKNYILCRTRNCKRRRALQKRSLELDLWN